MAASSERLNAALKILKGETLPSGNTKSHAPEKFVSLAQAARELGINRMTLDRYRCPSHNHFSCKRYRISEILAYFESDTFRRTIIALKANGWKRPTDEQVARVTLEPDPQTETAGAGVGGDHV